MGPCSPLKVWRVGTISFLHDHKIKKRKHITKNEVHYVFDISELTQLSSGHVFLDFLNQRSWPNKKFSNLNNSIFYLYFYVGDQVASI